MKRKDVVFAFKALIVALVVMAILQALPTPDGAKPNASLAAGGDLVSLRASELQPLLKNANGKTTMLFIYASWCGYCRQLMPGVIEMLRNNELSHLNTLFVSIDTKLPALTAYLKNKNYEGAFTPYVIKRNPANPLAKTLASIGGSYNGNIPYVAFIDASGQLITEGEGMPERNELRTLIESFK